MLWKRFWLLQFERWSVVSKFLVFSSADIRFLLMSTFTTKDSPTKEAPKVSVLRVTQYEARCHTVVEVVCLQWRPACVGNSTSCPACHSPSQCLKLSHALTFAPCKSAVCSALIPTTTSHCTLRTASALAEERLMNWLLIVGQELRLLHSTAHKVRNVRSSLQVVLSLVFMFPISMVYVLL